MADLKPTIEQVVDKAVEGKMKLDLKYLKVELLCWLQPLCDLFQITLFFSKWKSAHNFLQILREIGKIENLGRTDYAVHHQGKAVVPNCFLAQKILWNDCFQSDDNTGYLLSICLNTLNCVFLNFLPWQSHETNAMDILV